MGGYWPWIKNRKVRERERLRDTEIRYLWALYWTKWPALSFQFMFSSIEHPNKFIILTIFFFWENYSHQLNTQIKNVVINISLFNINIIYFQFQHLFSYFQLVQITLMIMGIRKHFPVQQNKRFFSILFITIAMIIITVLFRRR